MIAAAVQDHLIDDALSRVAVIHQQHSMKCCLAILRLVERFPEWGSAVVELAKVMREEPAVPDIGSQLPCLADVRTVADRTHIIQKALFPAAYAAMREWAERDSLDAVLESYRERACLEPDYLGHNVSIYCSFLGMRRLLGSKEARRHRFLDRFTEFVTATFHCTHNRIVFETRPHMAEATTADSVLDAAFRQPGFFGHQILSFVWARRYSDELGLAAYDRVLAHLHEMSYWEIPERNVFSIEPAEDPLEEGVFAQAIKTLAFHGPESIHRVTLADALVDVWDAATEDRIRALSLSAARHFAHSPRA